MSKTSKKKAKELTMDEAMDRVFGEGAAKRLRAAVARLHRQKPQKSRPKDGDK
jgi:hypothetical protein